MVQYITYGLKGIQLYLILTVFPLAYNVWGNFTFILTNNLIPKYLYLVQLNFVQLVFVVCLTKSINHQSHSFLWFCLWSLISYPVFIMPGPFDSIISFCEIVNFVAIVDSIWINFSHWYIWIYILNQLYCIYALYRIGNPQNYIHSYKSVKIFKSTNIHII